VQIELGRDRFADLVECAQSFRLLAQHFLVCFANGNVLHKS